MLPTGVTFVAWCSCWFAWNLVSGSGRSCARGSREDVSCYGSLLAEKVCRVGRSRAIVVAILLEKRNPSALRFFYFFVVSNMPLSGLARAWTVATGALSGNSGPEQLPTIPFLESRSTGFLPLSTGSTGPDSARTTDQLFWHCPDLPSLQDPAVKQHFSIEKMPGTYYEMVLHDYTQYPVCVSGPTCVRSVKTLVPTEKSGGKQKLLDNFTLGCFGKPYSYGLDFDVNPQNPGVLEGHWKGVTGGLVYPDAVMAFKESTDATPQYDWVIEFQCLTKGPVAFTGINLYSKHPSNASRDEMLQKMEDLRLTKYLDAKPWGR